MNYTPKQLEILHLIKRSQAERGYSPTYAEIAKVMDVSPVTIFEHISALEKKGAVRRRKYEARSLEITDSGFDQRHDTRLEEALIPLRRFLKSTENQPDNSRVRAGDFYGILLLGELRNIEELL
jgi:SOS-response transcriptional repressor LexA